MSNKVEYLEKYSVAPSPSRDYYGIKVLRDEIILFLWKISHGPHRAPAIRVSKFSEFGSNKILQDEIQRIFGNYLLDHVRKIAAGKEFSILTLPINVIARISNYLKIEDITNLLTLSRASKEVFDNDVVWEVIYRKHKGTEISKEEKKYAMASSWKQLLKDRQLQESIKSPKSCTNKPKTSIDSTKQFQKNPNFLFRKATEDSKKFSSLQNKPSKLDSEKKQNNVKSMTSITIIPAESKQKLLLSNQLKIVPKEKKSKTNRSQVIINKNINQQSNSLTKPKSLISTENPKCRKISSDILNPKLKSNKADVIKIKKLPPDSKIQKKGVGKPKKVSESKLNTFGNDKTLFNYNHDDDISSLIEEGLKKMKSPRSIFNYDFSVLDDKKSSGDSKILSPRLEVTKLIKDFGYIEGIPNSSAKSEIQKSDDDEKSDTDQWTENYLNARAEFMKSITRVSNFPFLKAHSNLSNNSSLGEKFRKSLSTIPEDLQKTRASIFAAKEEKSQDIINELSKIHLANENNT